MPKGPRGEKRPADVVSAAVMVGRIATGEMEEPVRDTSAKRQGAVKGGKARAESLGDQRRSEIAKKAASARWKKGPAAPGKKERA